LVILFAITAAGVAIATSYFRVETTSLPPVDPTPLVKPEDILSVSDLIAYYFEASGGRAAIAEMRSIRYEGRVQISSGEWPFQILLLAPDMGKLSINPGALNNSSLLLNGEVAWQVIENHDGLQKTNLLDERSAESLQWSLQIQNPFRRILLSSNSAPGFEMRETQFKGTDCYELTKTLPNGTVFLALLDKDSLYVVRTEETVVIAGQPLRFAVEYEDYRMVSGVVEPFRTRFYRDGELENEVFVESIRVNAGIMSSLFKIPESIRSNSPTG